MAARLLYLQLPLLEKPHRPVLSELLELEEAGEPSVDLTELIS